MIELSQLTLLILIEVLIGLAILSGLLGYFALSRKGRVRKAAHHLAQRVQNDEPARTERLKSLLQERYGLSGDGLERSVHDIKQAEMRLFQNLINGYIAGDMAHLQQVDVDEENLVLAYQALKPAGGGEAVSPSSDGDAEMQRLREENERLAEELRVTMDTMGRMLNEYSSMFSGGDEKPLTRMVAGSGAAAAAAGDGETGDEDSADLLEASDIEEETPGLSAEEIVDEALLEDPDRLLDPESAASSQLEEEVSEIIDEVMEIADEMTQHEDRTDKDAPQADLAESLLDELEQVDIELPETAGVQTSDETQVIEAEPESGSLEEEWAKLLEEEASEKEKPDKQ